MDWKMSCNFNNFFKSFFLSLQYFKKIFFVGLLFLALGTTMLSAIDLGIDRFFVDGYGNDIKGKKVALVINQTSVNKNLESTLDVFLKEGIEVVKIFSPEHGIFGVGYSGEGIENSKINGVEVISLHGEFKRPTKEMLKNVDVIIYDIQETGCRAYTYSTTLFYIMEEASKMIEILHSGIEVFVLDRPNPINGFIVDGPFLTEGRGFLGYINVPYCHGMTIGELANFFNCEYKINCKLKIVPMVGWKRRMSFKDTGLNWIPTSPQIPESDTPIYCATTGIIGELNLVNIGVGYTMPFKILGAPWINGKKFAKALNKQNFPGVLFMPFYFRPFFGLFKGIECQGVKIVITDVNVYKPIEVQCLLIGMLKTLYPKESLQKLKILTEQKKSVFCQVVGNTKFLDYLLKDKYVTWKMIDFYKNELSLFLSKREKYVIYD